jgi:selenocysteine lyase/cysteine desulfurase
MSVGLSERKQTGTKLFPEGILSEIRSRIAYVDESPYDGKRIFLDNASGALRLKSLAQVAAQEILLADQFGRPTLGAKHTREIRDRGFDDVRLLLGAKPETTVIQAPSATAGMFRLVHAATAFFPGTNVVTTAIEHPCVCDSTRLVAEQYGKEWRVTPVNRATGFVEPESILSLVDKDTYLLVFQHGANLTGALMDAKRIVKEARRIKPDLCIFIDGVQYVPHAPVDFDELGVDAYLVGAYKLWCKRGLAFAALSDRMAVIPHDKVLGRPANDWVLGPPDQLDLAAWSCVVDYLCWLGAYFTKSRDRRELLVAAASAMKDHEIALLSRMLHGTAQQMGLRQMNHVVVSAIGADLSDRCALVPFNIKGISASEACARYAAKKIIVQSRVRDPLSKSALEALGMEEMIRCSASHFTSPEEIDCFLQATEEMVV